MTEASHNDDDNSHDVEEEFEEDLEDDDVSEEEEEEEWQDTNLILNYELIFVYSFRIKPFCHSLHSTVITL